MLICRDCGDGKSWTGFAFSVSQIMMSWLSPQEQIYRESEDQTKSEMPFACPDKVESLVIGVEGD